MTPLLDSVNYRPRKTVELPPHLTSSHVDYILKDSVTISCIFGTYQFLCWQKHSGTSPHTSNVEPFYHILPVPTLAKNSEISPLCSGAVERERGGTPLPKFFQPGDAFGLYY